MYIYELTKIVDLISCGSKDIFKNAVLCTNAHHDITDLVNHAMVRNTKIWIPSKWSIIFLQNKIIFNLGLNWRIFRSYCFEAEVNFKFPNMFEICCVICKPNTSKLLTSQTNQKAAENCNQLFYIFQYDV